MLENCELTFERLKLSLPDKKRPFYEKLNIDNTRGALVYGQRGVGKTTFLLDKIRNKNFLYFSADNPLISSLPLYDFVQEIFKKGYEGIVIDEIHHSNSWSLNVKALFDDYPDKYIWISDSSNLMLKKSVADLSRRFVQYRIPMLSFREYVYLVTGRLTEKIDIFNFQKSFLSDISELNILKLFNDYLDFGIRPIFFEGEYCSRLKNLIGKSLYSDIPFYVKSIQDSHLRLMNAIIGHLLISPVPTINVSGMCSEWGIGKEKLYDILYVMEHSELINIVRKKNKHNYSKGSKIFLSDPSCYHCFRGDIGNVREAFFVLSMKELYELYASDDEKECDYIVNNKKFEIGGRNKKRKNAEYIVSDDLDIPLGNRLPLWMAGFQY
ncbi:ATP-binding protein [Flexistipes sp.]|uniref:ATP-binding protein n=1 Tax=Flexistipes sp. TaxID=3088135 RepID=UPI002E243DFA|nr:AAA family ATPase [Flexistipes sp.]